MERILSPSMLSIDFNHMEDGLKTVYDAGAKYIHVDVMDGQFVPNISFGAPVIKFVRKAVPDAVLDVHLMVEEPTRFLEDFKAAGADILTIHAEAVKHLDRAVHAIKEAGMKVGVAVNPSTDLSVLNYILPEIDMVLIMSVNPGFGGQKFIPYCVEKIKTLKAMVDKTGKEIDIEVDGGVTLENVDEILNAGANVIVAGSAVFNGDSKINVKSFLEHF